METTAQAGGSGFRRDRRNPLPPAPQFEQLRLAHPQLGRNIAAQHVLRCSVRDNATIGRQRDHPPDDANQFIGLMAGDQHGPAAFAVQVIDRSKHLGLADRIKLGRRLVHNQDLRFHRQRRGDRHALFLAAGQMMRKPVAKPGHADGEQTRHDATLDFCHRKTQILRPEREFLLHRFTKELRFRTLQHDADPPGNLVNQHVPGVQFVHGNRARHAAANRVRDEPVESEAQCRLSRAVRTHDADRFTFPRPE